jgi:mono/diheme cytochrome c family protein
MTYQDGVGIDRGGQFAQTSAGVSRLRLALAGGRSEVAAGRVAFSYAGLGCASCHGDRALGKRGPDLAGGIDLEQFRRVHATGLFPRSMVSDHDFAAIDAWLRTLPGGRRRGASGD